MSTTTIIVGDVAFLARVNWDVVFAPALARLRGRVACALRTAEVHPDAMTRIEAAASAKAFLCAVEDLERAAKEASGC